MNKPYEMLSKCQQKLLLCELNTTDKVYIGLLFYTLKRMVLNKEVADKAEASLMPDFADLLHTVALYFNHDIPADVIVVKLMMLKGKIEECKNTIAHY